MNKQELAQKRNWFKFYIVGVIRCVPKNTLTAEEQKLYQDFIDIRSKLISGFDENSRQLGLTVPAKCWCNKPAKWNYLGKHPGIIGKKVCKKHRYDD